MDMTAGEIAAATGGSVIGASPDARATSFSIDSRTMQPGGCFVALEADRDGHDFIGDAFARGATVAIVRRSLAPPSPVATLVRVVDSAHAVTTLAGIARARLGRAHVVGITGSAGKTATKDLTTAALARGGRRVHASPLSFNNELGLPLTLLGADASTEVVVAEMGARFAGNIAELAAVAQPDVGVITHIGMAHAEHLDGPAGIARVKGELVEALPASGLAVLNDDDPETAGLTARTQARVLRVGTTSRADVVVERVELDRDLRPSFRISTPAGAAAVRLELRGAHQAVNAAMATAVAVELGVSLADAVGGLADARPQPHRMAVLQSTDGVAVINDAYNSSPTSAAAALRALAGLPVEGRRVAVLGEMRELGAHSQAEHGRIGELAGTLGIDTVVAVGGGVEALAVAAENENAEVIRVSDVGEAAGAVAERVRPGDAVLVKASRAVGLEELAEALIRGRVAR